uniref:poly(A)-specific ribonuclease n=1 Tax=Oryza punctata TaxID=4537 RepID=A0A0E0L7J1_ORYPU
MPSFPGDLSPVMLATPPPPLPFFPIAATSVQSGLSFVMHMSAPPEIIPGRSKLNSDAPSFSPRSAAAVDEVEVRDVWAANLEEEMHSIGALLKNYPVVSMDTEFPGTVHDGATPRHLRTPEESYAVVKRNVDKLHLLQLGVALSGPTGRCPVVWQFNFAGFDARRDPHSRSSIAMLAAHGMDFALLRHYGIEHDDFARAFRSSELGRGCLTWAAFSGSYDFAYLVKVLTGGRPLPNTLEGFLAKVGKIFGPMVLDVKHLAKFCGDGGGIRGGLEHVAAAIGVQRAAGRAHNAGSDSLLTSDVLHAMVDRFFPNSGVLNHAGAIEGLVKCSNMYYNFKCTTTNM